MTPFKGQHLGQYADLARLLVRCGRSDLIAQVGLDEFADPADATDVAAPEAAALAADLERRRGASL